ncbi:hypothetical protein IE81DRAFT_321257 [Ceraceosorus guamensis]|uniref:Uncharacterized protein n=1 Tax=Ceraceosorus guamensis TaxID=1522189 RepID=A0A316W3B9_9BASI|nr:hypothetical protein IE81DRAFT_321257 [Ceraceosorus guamensis]PWN44366.1 hypothetical protein IE81DRAFT_321257 [Ceraceosorus guamensis]
MTTECTPVSSATRTCTHNTRSSVPRPVPAPLDRPKCSKRHSFPSQQSLAKLPPSPARVQRMRAPETFRIALARCADDGIEMGNGEASSMLRFPAVRVFGEASSRVRKYRDASSSHSRARLPGFP